MTKAEIKKILKNHAKWLDGEGGEKANLCGANLYCADLNCSRLRGADLRNADLRRANLRYADLRGANLRGADLCNANLCSANLRSVHLNDAKLRGANLCYADLDGADLCGSDLDGAELRGADLCCANLMYANMYNANLNRANLSQADLRGAKNTSTVIHDSYTVFYSMQCPEEGSYIAYKQADGKIVKLLIPEDAKRSSATSRQCRASKAYVIDITDISGDMHCSFAKSDHDHNFIYRVGETVEVKDFDENRWNEWSTGIHHFITRAEAVTY